MQLTRHLLLLVFFLSIGHYGLAQSEKVTSNRKSEYARNYFPKERAADTLYVIFDTQQDHLRIVDSVLNVGEYKFQYKRYEKTYPPPTDSCVKLVFYHNAGPPLGHEEYRVTKTEIKPENLVRESERDFLYWFDGRNGLSDMTLILIEKKEWERNSPKVRGMGVQLHTFGSCNHFIEESSEDWEGN